MYDQNSGGYFSESIGQGIRNSFLRGSALTRLIYINCGVFLALKVLSVFFLMGGEDIRFYPVLLEWVGVPTDPLMLLSRPWTLLTYMFTQFEFLHLLFNMLWLYWFGSLFLRHFTERQLTGVYLLGGAAGALLYVVAYNTLPYFDGIARLSSWAIGSSASVMAIVFAVCTYLPRYKVYVFLIGPVKLIYLALFTALIDLLSIHSGNAGGHIAHLGGALFGWLFILGLRNNKDLSSGLVRLLDKFRQAFSPRKRLHVRYRKKVSDMNDREYNQYKKEQEDRIDRILEKISKSGYESLTREEKELLFKNKQ